MATLEHAHEVDRVDVQLASILRRQGPVLLVRYLRKLGEYGAGHADKMARNVLSHPNARMKAAADSRRFA